MDPGLTELSIEEAAALFDAGKLSPVELTQAYLQRIHEFNPQLNAFLTLLEDQALAAAHQAEGELRRGERRGPLHGIPYALKDLYETRQVRTTMGSRFFANNLPEKDAVVVERMSAAGAILLGKLNMHEIALGVTNQNPHFGDCANPWDLARISGGSSGGSGAALAAGLCLIALGSDTGGSIRIPASLCGILGLKPTYGRVSLRGVLPLSWNLDHAGPMARGVRDAALLLQAIAGYDPHDPASSAHSVPDYLANLDGGIQGWRVAWADDDFFRQADPSVLAAVSQAARVFESLGAQVEPAVVPGALEAARANGLMVVSDAAALHHERLLAEPDGFGEDVLRRLRRGMETTARDYILARRTQSVMRRQFELFLNPGEGGYDLLLTPATPVTATTRLGLEADEQAAPLTRFTATFNLTGLPALVLPCGFDQSNLPIGLQIVAGPWREAELLRGAYAYEQATTWHTYRPPGLG